MKYDNNQYYYSPSANYPWYLEDNKPDDAIPMTIKMEEEYGRGYKLGLIITPNPAYSVNKFNDNDTSTYPFLMVHPDSLLSQQELLERDKQRQLALAKQQLDQSIKLESGVYQRKMSEEQQYEFIMYQDALLEFINGERPDMPTQPNFITELL